MKHPQLITGATLFLAVLALLLLLASRQLGNPYAPATEADYVGTELGREPAADFRLLDQHGMPTGLSDFRGKPVVLAFLAPECTDVCPLTASQLRQASEVLVGEDVTIALLAVNTNPQLTALSDVASASERWGVAALPNWHYVTGNPEDLGHVWRAYNVYAGGPKANKPQETEHSAGVYLIDQEGRLRWFIAVPYGIPGFRPLDQLLVEHVRALK